MTEQALLTVTSAALEKIDAVRKSAGRPEDHLRIGIKGRRGATFEYEFVLVDALGQPPDDIAIDYPGLRVLVDPKSAELLRGTTMDVDPIGGSMRIANPNEGWKDQLARRAQK
ncbi:MAG: iron-sulfur cluster assembly accessory protein, partial [Chloroflexota bacterium]|nr:iron-sulfur cluster assembly accessory protein [Chloroflexota bacterium]